MAKRVRVSWRVKGGKKPDDVVVVARPSKWGNPYRVGDDVPGQEGEPMDAEDACHYFRLFTLPSLDVSELRGKDLACYCPLDQPCHADALIEKANS